MVARGDTGGTANGRGRRLNQDGGLTSQMNRSSRALKLQLVFFFKFKRLRRGRAARQSKVGCLLSVSWSAPTVCCANRKKGTSLSGQEGHLVPPLRKKSPMQMGALSSSCWQPGCSAPENGIFCGIRGEAVAVERYILIRGWSSHQT